MQWPLRILQSFSYPVLPQEALYHSIPAVSIRRIGCSPVTPAPYRRATRPAASPLADIEDDEGELQAKIGSLSMEIRQNMNKFAPSIVLTQVGKFYESAYEQAPLVAEACNITLTSKEFKKRTAVASGVETFERIPWAGFPTISLKKHLRTLVEKFGAVAIVEEVGWTDDTPKTRIRLPTRIVTPATLLDDGLFDTSIPQFLLAIVTLSEPPATASLAWIDVATGELFEQSTTTNELRDIIARISPVEMVLQEGDPHLRMLNEITTVSGIRLATHASMPTTATSGSELALSYLAHLIPRATHDAEVTAIASQDVLTIDAAALTALEIRSSAHRAGSILGSLIHAVRRTVTPGGSRLLISRLSAPSANVTEIRRRHDIVDGLCSKPSTHLALREALKSSGDHARNVQKIRSERVRPELLRSLQAFLVAVCDIKAMIEKSELVTSSDKSLQHLSNDLVLLPELAASVAKVVLPSANDGAASHVTDRDSHEDDLGVLGSLFHDWPFGVKEQASQELADAHSHFREVQELVATLEEQLRAENNISGRAQMTLTRSLREEPYIRLKGKGSLSGHQLIRELKTAKHYRVEAWSRLYRSLIDARQKIEDIENAILGQIQNTVLQAATPLRRNGHVFDELDVSLGFAILAAEQGHIRPEMTEDDSLSIIDGMHPVVTEALSSQGRYFVPNGLDIGGSSPRMAIVTGPNMGGKSTFLRQAALLVVLAQAGAFVPATSAKIGVCDAIYTRVGASDDLFRGHSTFMLEMVETAHILRDATSRSLIIMDEIGRGTAPHEGVAVAFAVADYLINVTKARTLFATHFHQVIDLLRGTHGDAISLLSTELSQQRDGSLIFSHRVIAGVNTKSGALAVAKLAGLPRTVLERAEGVIDAM